MATHSRNFAWRIPWTEEPGRLQFMGSQGVRCDCSNIAHSGYLSWCSKELSLDGKVTKLSGGHWG